MYFGKKLAVHVATSVITYKLISYGDEFYSIAKCDVVHDSIKWIARNIRNKDAIMLIWNDVINGAQK